MKRRVLRGLSLTKCAYAVVATLSLVDACEAVEGGSNERLALTLEINRTSLASSDEIRIDVRIVNVGSKPQFVFGSILWGYQGGMVLHVEDAQGDPVDSHFLDHDRIIPSDLTRENSYVLLQPRHYLGTTRVQPVADLIQAPGTYHLWLEYLSPVPEGFAPVEGVWSRQAGRLRSEVAVLEIVE